MKYRRSEAKPCVLDTMCGYIDASTAPFQPDLKVDYSKLHHLGALLTLPGTRGPLPSTLG